MLLDFFATWCPPCVVEVAELNAFYAGHRDQGVELVAISVDELPAEHVRAFADEHGIAYPVALGSIELAEAYGADSFPFHVLVSRAGRVLERLPPGLHDRHELAELVARHVSSRSASASIRAKTSPLAAPPPSKAP